MSHAWSVGPQLLAALSIHFNIVWWRLVVVLMLFAGMGYAAWALGDKKK